MITKQMEEELYDLIGSSGTQDCIEDIFERAGQEMTAKDAYIVDTIVFSCGHCGWYCEACDIHDSQNGEWICSQCYQDENSSED